jgi:hypothetical protein
MVSRNLFSNLGQSEIEEIETLDQLFWEETEDG